MTDIEDFPVLSLQRFSSIFSVTGELCATSDIKHNNCKKIIIFFSHKIAWLPLVFSLFKRYRFLAEEAWDYTVIVRIIGTLVNMIKGALKINLHCLSFRILGKGCCSNWVPT